MDYNELKDCLLACPDLAGLDEGSIASLFWRGQHLALESGALIYAENTLLDDTFCLLLSGHLRIERAGTLLGEITDQQIFGEMAYFTSLHMRTATVRVGSAQAIVMKFQLTSAELASPPFFALKRYLGLQAWDRFVSSTQMLAYSPELCGSDPPRPPAAEGP